MEWASVLGGKTGGPGSLSFYWKRGGRVVSRKNKRKKPTKSQRSTSLFVEWATDSSKKKEARVTQKGQLFPTKEARTDHKRGEGGGDTRAGIKIGTCDPSRKDISSYGKKRSSWLHEDKKGCQSMDLRKTPAQHLYVEKKEDNWEALRGKRFLVHGKERTVGEKRMGSPNKARTSRQEMERGGPLDCRGKKPPVLGGGKGSGNEWK